MRTADVLAIALLVPALFATVACAHGRDAYEGHVARSDGHARYVDVQSGRYALVVRAWEGREPMTSRRAAAATEFALRQLGKPYCWGGTGPGCFDCSGLVQTAWAQAGVSLPRTADAIAATLDEVPLEEVRSGDILWWPGHVALYAGYGWTVEALDSRSGVVRRPSKNPARALRPRLGPVSQNTRQNWP